MLRVRLRQVRLVDAVRQRRGGRLVNQAQHVQAGDRRAVQHRAALLLGEEAGDGEDAVRDLGALVLLADGLQLAQQRRQQLLGAKSLLLAHVLHAHHGHLARAVRDSEVEGGRVRHQLRVAGALAEQTLQLPDGVLGLHADFLARRDADEALRHATRGSGTLSAQRRAATARQRASAPQKRPPLRRPFRPHTCLAAKFTMDGVSRLLSLFSTTSMPLRRASATTDVALPTSMPSTDMAAYGAAEIAR